MSRRVWSVAKITAALAVATAVLYFTNPSHIRHVSQLFPGRPVPGDLIDVAGLSPAERQMVERNHPATSNTTYHDFVLFSTTTGRSDGGLTSVGFLRMVFDFRSDRQKGID